jgi:2-polyprenyl-6-methoxyphenol hydroxylase-like FAD-dependent oxidoreductase
MMPDRDVLVNASPATRDQAPIPVRSHAFDVIVAGGGIAGSAMAAVLARAGLGVLLVERESAFRDRIRGEISWPWGVTEATRVGLMEPLERAGRVEIPEIHHVEERALAATHRWEAEPMIGFSHPRVQETLFTWAGELGATTLRPAKAVGFANRNGRATVTVAHDGQETEYTARLVIGADGKRSQARRWAGDETVSDPEHHRFGGVLTTGSTFAREALNLAMTPALGVLLFATGADTERLYLRMPAERVRETDAARSFDAFVRVAASRMPDGTFTQARQAGPLGFFPNSNVWASTIAAERIVLIGDAAGAADPSLGHGTSLLFKDVRELSELLLGEPDWDAALAEFARRRQRYYDVIRAHDRWYALLGCASGPEADRRRERHQRAKELDPTLGGFAFLEERGPDGLVADEAARRHYFGEDLEP